MSEPQAPASDAARAAASGASRAAGTAAPPAQAPSPETTPTLRSTGFRREREAGWRRLESILERAERQGMRALSFEEARDLAVLYRQAVSALSVAREISLDAALRAYLEALCARACLAVYAPQETLSGLFGRFLRGVPPAFRRSAPHLGIVVLVTLLGALVGWLLYFQDATWYYTLVPSGGGDPRGPDSTADELREVLEGPHEGPLGGLAAFASFLFSHNARIAIFCFSLGALAGMPTLLLCLYNGLSMGAFVALHVDRGLGMEVAGWLSIHGVTEIGAILIAAAAGLRLGEAVLFPGPRSRGDALRAQGRDAVKLALLAALMLVLAALLEGFGRQLVTGLEARLAIGWGIGAVWMAWFLLGSRRPAP
ncbi:stage II sporulation protein M [Paroceanicella profunda]|uniref:Stage II sporulation protein M n=1 Tax=Paroceanicella profunda TaxID=2579971 RepID=A0A5B8FVB5_9RHOB|nr:stage II sporulation protein M [Paroceanicella profunda]QDL91050.1 stage II sporulation protein M [Paroceanicella profunda]